MAINWNSVTTSLLLPLGISPEFLPKTTTWYYGVNKSGIPNFRFWCGCWNQIQLDHWSLQLIPNSSNSSEESSATVSGYTSKLLQELMWETLCNPVDQSPPGSSVHEILQARILEWVAILISRGSFQSRDQTPIPCIAGRFFSVWATRETPRGRGYMYTYCDSHCWTVETNTSL